jgi:hypothetical protein
MDQRGDIFPETGGYGGYQALHVLHQSGATTEQLSLEFYPPGGPQAQLSTGSLWNTTLTASSGVLLRGQPYLAELAWMRRNAGPEASSTEASYSLAGLIHTIAPPAICEQIAAAALERLLSSRRPISTNVWGPWKPPWYGSPSSDWWIGWPS